MLIFKPVDIYIKEEIESYLIKSGSEFSDYCFVDIFIWRDLYRAEYCIKDNYLFLRKKVFPNSNYTYNAPLGEGRITEGLKYILQDTKQKKITPIITSISVKQKEELENTYPNKFNFEMKRDLADYVYKSEDLINLRGNKYNAKRNYVNRFLRNYINRWQYEEIEDRNKNDVLLFYNEWYSKKLKENCRNINGNDYYFKSEKSAINYALDYFNELSLRGGILRVDGKVVAFAIGKQCTDKMFVIQFEKADKNIIGAYQMINQQFAIKNCNNIEYINREEDLGIAGLRKAKLSYYPLFLGIKYEARLRDGDE